MKNYIVRDARREDCQEIRRLIQELADFEKMPNGPEIGARDLERDGFDLEHPLFFSYVAESCETPGVLVGYTLQYYVYGSWKGRKMYLEDIYVTESHRGTGVGFALFQKVVEKAVETNCNDMEFIVLDWNPAQEFYLKLGASDISTREGWRLFRLTRPAMNSLVLPK